MKFEALPTPVYVVDEKNLISNLEILRGVERRTGCKVLMAQKAFSMFALYPLIRQYLSGTASSGLYEARLGAEEFGKENHVFSPRIRWTSLTSSAASATNIVFNPSRSWKNSGPLGSAHKSVRYPRQS
jgi:carboxynorspermidine decarboxylase